MAKRRRKRYFNRIRWSAATWLCLLLCAVVFFVVLFRFPVIPFKWKLLILSGITMLMAITAYFSLKKQSDYRKKGTGITAINAFLSVLLATASVLLPIVEVNLRNVFKDVPETVSTKINIYAMTTDYKSAHSEEFKSRGLITDASLNNYANKQFITQTGVDQENQAYAIEKLENLFEGKSIWQNEQDTVWNAVGALYHSQGDALILNEAYVDLIEDTDEYQNFTRDTIVLYSFSKESEAEKNTKDADLTKPFNIFIAGSDSRDAQLTTVTRTDVNIIATVNPEKKTVILTSVPRDSFIPNPQLDNANDKLTHMGVYGIDNSLEALSSWMDIELDDYTLVNFATYKTIINAIGGVDVDNPYAFSTDGYDFEATRIHLDGDSALAYVRERKSLEAGDFNRNEHQIIVLRAILRKMLSPENIVNLNNVLQALNGTFMTDLSSDSIFRLISEQIDRPGNWNIIAYHITGSTGMDVTASMPGQELSVVYPNMNQVEFVVDEIEKLLNGEDVYQQQLS